MQQNQQAQLRLINSYMHKTNEEAAKANHKYMKDVPSVFRQRMDSLVDLELEVTRLMTVLITKTQQVADMKRQLDCFYARYSPPNPTSSISLSCA